jgi:bifunctional non-homologous end joining protein LigD
VHGESAEDNHRPEMAHLRRAERALPRAAPADTGEGGAVTLAISHRDLMQATAAKRIPGGAHWIFELKYDGFRCLALKEGDCVRLLSRQGCDMAHSSPDIVAAMQALPGDAAIDGELVVVDHEGVPQFEKLARRARTRQPMQAAHLAKRDPAALFAFDLLWCLETDQRNLPLLERRETLSALLAHSILIRAVSHVAAGDELYAAMVLLELEGIVAKRPDSRYVAGRSPNWQKIQTPFGRPASRARSRSAYGCS